MEQVRATSFPLWRLSLLVVLLLAGWGLYLPSVRHEFINLDDTDYVKLNRHVTGGLTVDNVIWAWTTFAQSNWHPLTWMSLQLDSTLFGVAPFGYHLTNALLHGLNCGLVALVFFRLTGAWEKSLVVALLFMVHPQHVESVAWVTERKDVLSQFFGLLALWGYREYVFGGKRWVLLGSLAAYAASLLSKPMWVTLPCLLLLLDYWPLCRIAGWSPGNPEESRLSPRGLKALVFEKWPYWLLTVGMCVMTVLSQKAGDAFRSTEELPIAGRIANSLVCYWLYVFQTFYPTNLSIFYPHLVDPLPLWQPVLAGISLLGVFGLAWRYRLRAPALLVGWCWFMGTLFPVIGLTQVGNHRYADRFMYFPHLGLFLALVWQLDAGIPRGLTWTWMKRVAVSATVVLLAILTERYLWYWHDSVRLMEHAVAVTKNNAPAHTILGLAYYIEMRDQDALRELDRALTIPVRTKKLLATIHSRRGTVLLALNQTAAAEAEFLTAAAINPREIEARQELVELYRKRRQPEEIKRWLEEIIAVKPNHVPSLLQLGEVCLYLKQVDAARQHYAAAQRLDPASRKFVPPAFRDSPEPNAARAAP